MNEKAFDLQDRAITENKAGIQLCSQLLSER